MRSQSEWIWSDKPLPTDQCDTPDCVVSHVRFLFNEKNQAVYKVCFKCWDSKAVKKKEWVHRVSGTYFEFQEAKQEHHEELRKQWKEKSAERQANWDARAESDKEFFDSRSWSRLRYQAFLKLGRVCLCCGARPPHVVLHIDHIKPRSKYPELALDINNLQILCANCNIGKSNTDETDFREPEGAA